MDIAVGHGYNLARDRNIDGTGHAVVGIHGSGIRTLNYFTMGRKLKAPDLVSRLGVFRYVNISRP
jgi:hypothetical protein